MKSFVPFDRPATRRKRLRRAGDQPQAPPAAAAAGGVARHFLKYCAFHLNFRRNCDTKLSTASGATAVSRIKCTLRNNAGIISAMAVPDTDVIDAAHQVIVLAFDLVDAEIASLPEQIQKALLSPAVQKAITKSLLDFAKSKSAIGNNTVVSDEEAKKLADALRTGVTDAATKELMEKVKATSAYKQLQESIEAFQKAAKHSSLGVWIDKNKNVLYVVGAALVLGSASALYITKTGGTLLNAALDPLKGKEFEVLQVGKLTLKA